jgi:general secretion pathway protein A
MYRDYFGLTTKPFQITSDPTFLWLGEKHKEALATLRYGIQDNRGFLLLTGEVGTGKTILVNKLISLLDGHTVVATLPDPELGSMDFYKLLADGLNIKQPFHTKAEFLIRFREFLHQCYAAHKQVLLIIDESQRLTPHLMEEIRVLSNIEMQDRKLINIFFVGQPEFNSMLMIPGSRALSQRITVRYNVESLDQQETHDYVNYRLRVAGSKKPIFSLAALNEIYRFSGGIPRLINIICDHALLTAFSKNLKKVDANIIMECVEELRIPVEMTQSNVATLRTEEEAYSNVDASPALRSRTLEPHRSRISDILLKCGNIFTLPSLPLRWKLFYYGGILLILVAIVVTVTYHTGDPAQRGVDPGEGAKEVKTIPKHQERQEAENISRSEQPPGDQHSTGENPEGDIAATMVKGNLSKSDSGSGNKIVPAVSTPSTKKMPNGSADNGFSAISGGGASYGPLPAIEEGTSAETQFGPLPLLKEKVLVQFKFNSNEIEEASYAALDRIAHYLAGHPTRRIVIRGYTDSEGPESYNKTVSSFRANAVKSYLVAKGVTAENMAILALGDLDPIASNETVAGRRKNRRVEVEFLEDQ